MDTHRSSMRADAWLPPLCRVPAPSTIRNTSMKKTLFAVALAAVGFAAIPAAFAQSAPTQTAQQGWYVGAEAGYGQINKGPYDSNGNAIGGIKGGYRFAINPETSIGVEAGY